MEESPVDRLNRASRRIGFVAFIGLCALDVVLLANEYTRVLGVVLVIVIGFAISYYLGWVADEIPYRWRQLFYRGWHGRYRAFDDQRVRVIDGQRDTPSQVFAADIFRLLGEDPPAFELSKLEARYGSGFVRGAEGEADGEWLFSDVTCMAFVRSRMDAQRSERGRTAQRLAIWLERSVFMPIDNRRTRETGKTYTFTSGTRHP
jgi:hypothetical protein